MSRCGFALRQLRRSSKESNDMQPTTHLCARLALQTLANVHKLHRNIRGTIKDMKKELTEASPSSARGLSSSRVYR